MTLLVYTGRLYVPKIRYSRMGRDVMTPPKSDHVADTFPSDCTDQSGEPNHSAVLSVSSGTCVARGTSGVVRRVLWVPFPVPHRVLRLILVLKERLLDLSVNADEPFFCTSGTVSKIIRLCLKFACFFFGCPQL
jgi:hypothetical protein